MSSLCGWCGCDLGDGTPDSHGICDTCMATVFGVNPQEIHAEIAAEEAEKSEKQDKKVAA